jgi:NAD+ diphosphatase
VAPASGERSGPAAELEDVYCFGGNPLDRASERRADGQWIAGLLADSETRILALRDLKPFTRGGAAPAAAVGTPDMAPALDWQAVAPWRGQIDAGATLIFLGLGDRRAHFAIDATGADVAPDVDTELIDVRALAPSLAAGEAAILAEARSLLDWHGRHRFCAQCGSATRVASAGWVRRCPDCRASHFPRTDPVVIMLAVSGERALLGRNRRRAGARFSCLAGFVEPGETLEEAVRREVREESGIRCGRVRYLAGQPWPFPSSLMLGFLAEALTEEITVDPEELAEARWFTRGEIRQMVERAAAGADDPTRASLPAPIAIAHHICRRWSYGLDAV